MICCDCEGSEHVTRPRAHTGSAWRTWGHLRTCGPPSVWRRGRPLHVEAGRPCPSRETTCWQDRNAHLELKALQRQAPCSPAPQVWELSERGGRGRHPRKGAGGGAAPSERGGACGTRQPPPPPSVSHQLSDALTILLRWGLGPGTPLHQLCSASLTLRTPGSRPESWMLGWERP